MLSIVDEEDFESIKDIYAGFERELRQTGKGVVWDTSKGIYGTSDCSVLFDFFRRIHLSSYKSFLDLGSGDGRAVLIASLFTNATGIEVDDELAHIAGKIKNRVKKRNTVKLVNDDYMDHEFLEHDIIFINPDKSFSPELEQKLSESKADVFVYGIVYKPNKLKKGRTYWIDQVPVTRYKG